MKNILIALYRRTIATLVLLASALLISSALHAQSLTTIDTFTLSANPVLDVPRRLIQGSDGNFYATALTAPNLTGSLLKISRTGSISTVPVSPVTDCFAMIQASDGNFYGMSSSLQTVCQILPDGTSSPIAGFQQGLLANGIGTSQVIVSSIIQGADGFLYGTDYGPSLDEGFVGVVWKMSLSGSFTVVATFPPDVPAPSAYSIFLQGADGNFYGTTVPTTAATIFKTTSSGNLTTLYTFDGEPFPSGLVYATDGALYGITDLGGTSNNGTFFKIDSAGNFSVLYNATSPMNASLYGSVLVQGSDGNFYGLQSTGGTNGDGILYSLTSNGIFSVLYNFGSDNTTPQTLITGSDGNIYGITASPTLAQIIGTIFKVTPGSSSSTIPSIGSGGIISASAFGAFTSIAPGTFIEIYGSNLASDTRGWTGSDFDGVNAPTSLDGTSVSIGGQAAFVNYISSGQVNVLVPSTVPTGPQTLTVTTPAGTSSTSTVNVNAVEPGLLAPVNFNIGGAQYVVALFGDGTYVLPTGAISGLSSRPAKPGDEIVIYGVGFGPVTPDIPAGQLVQQANTLADRFEISIGGVPAIPAYDGLAPNYTGLYQFNITVPSGIPSGVAPLTFTVDGVAGTQTLNIAVQ